LKYIFNLVFVDVFGLSFEITSKQEEFKAHSGFKFVYAKEAFSNDLTIEAHTLLFESGIKEQTIQFHNDERFLKYFFKTYRSCVPFDLFAASFYLISRYEEYLPFKPDSYNRYEAESSLAYQYDFLNIPIVNLWLNEFEQILKSHFPELIIKHRKYNYISTIDIDTAYKYKQKGLMRTLGGYFKAILRFNKEDLVQRTSVLFDKLKDPFDSYDYHLEIQKKYNLSVIYFYLLGDYGMNDKNHPSNNFNFQKLIKHLSDYAQAGIHPSYGSNGHPEKVKIEINRLAQITHREIRNSRQHFSMLKFPETYSTILELGVYNDYSMGYANFNGFRASYCLPFYWYDIDDELETGLKIHPFCISETSLRFKHHASPQTVESIAKPLIDEVKKYNGELVTIFHNDTMGSAQDWQEWVGLYETIVKLAVEKQL